MSHVMKHACGSDTRATDYLAAREVSRPVEELSRAAAWYFFDEPNLKGQVVALPPEISYCPWCGEKLPKQWKPEAV